MAASSRAIQHSRVPSGRTERLAQMGLLAGRMALGAAAESARRLTGGGVDPGHVLLTPANARRLADSLSNLRGAAMKLGQLLSMEADDLLPEAVAEALAGLRDAGDAMPREQLHRVLSDAWGDDWESRFRDFDFDPIAAASIGQVHQGTAADGRELALKIQYPGVATSIDSDVDNLATALRIARILPGDVDFGPLLEEAKRQLRDEADYQTESEHLKRYAALLEDEPDVVVPRVHDDLTTPDILAMDLLDGVPLEDLCAPDVTDAERDRTATLLLRIVLREFFEFHFLQSDPNFANYLLMRDGRIGLIDLGAGYEAPEALCRGYAELFRACMRGDRRGLEAVAHDIGFLQSGDPPAKCAGLVELIELAGEPFREPGPFDFGATDLAARARQRSMSLVVDEGFWRPPPPETLFLQRKLGGTFLLCMRLRAKVDAQALLLEALDRIEAA